MFSMVFIIIFLFFAFLSFRNVKYGILFIIIATPFNLLIKVLLEMSLFSQIWHNLFILLLCFFILARSSVDGKYGIKINKIDVIFIVVFLFGILQVLYNYLISNSFYVSFQGFRTHYYGILLYFITRFSIKGPKDIKSMSIGIMSVILIASLELIIEFVFGSLGFITPANIVWIGGILEAYSEMYGSSSAYAMFPGLSSIRPVGIFFSIQYSAALILIGTLIGLPFWADKNLKHSHVHESLFFFKTPLFFITVIALLLSTARTIIFAFLIASFCMFIKYRMSAKKIIVVLLSTFFVLAITGVGIYLIKPLSGQDTHIQDTMSFLNSIPILFSKMTISSFFLGLGFNADPYAKNIIGVNTLYDEIFRDVAMGAEGIFKFFLNVGLSGAVLFIFQNILVFKRGVLLARNDIPSFFRNILLGLSFVIVGLCLSSVHVMPLEAAGIQYIYYVVVAIISSFSIEWFKATKVNK